MSHVEIIGSSRPLAELHFSTLTANIRRRRGSKVAINLPIFSDVNTPKPFVDHAIPYNREIFPEDPGRSPYFYLFLRWL